jgi:hypothetical protein
MVKKIKLFLGVLLAVLSLGLVGSLTKVEVSASGVGVPPTVSNGSIEGKQNQNVNFTIQSFENNYSCVYNNELFKIQIVSLPRNGSLRLGNQNITANQEILRKELNNMKFVPNNNFTGTVNFQWKGHNRRTYSDNTATMRIEIQANQTNQAPIFKNLKNRSIRACSNLSFKVTANDADGDKLT